MADLFAIPDFWKKSEANGFPGDGEAAAPLFNSKISDVQVPVSALDQVESLSSTKSFFRLPAGLDLQAPNEQTRLEGQHSANANAESLPEDGWDDGSPALDHWLNEEENAPRRDDRFRTWARFERPDVDDPAPLLMTEAGPAAFDEYLSSHTKSSSEDAILEARAYVACLLTLALGRISVLFVWDEATQSFHQTVPRARISGYSCGTLDGVRDACVECGNATRFLQSFVQPTYCKESSPYRIALARTANDFLRTTQEELGRRGRATRSMLQLEAVVDRVRGPLKYVDALVKRMSRIHGDGELLSALFEEARFTECQADIVHEIACAFLLAVSQPWMEFISQRIGLEPSMRSDSPEHGPGASFVTLGEDTEEDYILDTEKFPKFWSSEVSASIFQSSRNLQFLKKYHPDHMLLRPDIISSCQPPSLQWQFEWDAMASTEEQVIGYEAAIFRVIREGWQPKASSQSHGSRARKTSQGNLLEFFGKSEAEVEQRFLSSVKELDGPISDKKSSSVFTNRLRRLLFQDRKKPAQARIVFAPPWHLVSQLSFAPIVNTQARIINRECMQLLFKAHQLRQHLSLQRSFQLLGNGLFCARLADALFDPDAHSAARQAGVALAGSSMGLRLGGGRDNWPPASSELRLALMGILSECYYGAAGGHHSGPSASRGHRAARVADSELPGELSFAVRELSPEKTDKCMDPHALEALDFLHLSYKPPAQLQAVMTAAILEKYDRIFNFLLRLLRMLFVARQLYRAVVAHQDHWGVVEENTGVLRFRVEAHHFVQQAAAYFFELGVAGPWAGFDGWLDRVEAEALLPRRSDNDHCSPDRLRQRHESTLDDMLLTLLLRRRQQPVLKILEDIFTTILRFARAVGEDGDDDNKIVDVLERQTLVESLYRSFRSKVEAFLAACRALGEKDSHGSKRRIEAPDAVGGHRHDSRADENSIGQLVAMLDLSGYYGSAL